MFSGVDKNFKRECVNGADIEVKMTVRKKASTIDVQKDFLTPL